MRRKADLVSLDVLKDLKRFFNKVIKKVLKRRVHWIWVGAVHGGQPSRGYTGYRCGSFWHNGRAQSAHRFIWEVVNGPIPKGKQVNHRCGNRLCVNPAHMYLGDQSENMKDMHDHGHASGKQKGGKVS